MKTDLSIKMSTPGNGRSRPGRFPEGSPAAVILLLAAAVLAAYATALLNGVTYDDTIIWENEGFEELVSRPSALVGRAYFDLSKEMSYRPLVTATYILDYALWGRNPFFYHLVNLLWHLAAVLALYLLLSKILDDRRAAWLGALLFAVHPVNTEAVVSIGFREEMLCGTFYFLTAALLIGATNSDRPGRVVRLIIGSAAAGAALLSKEMALSLPLFLGLWGLWVQQGEKANEESWEKGPFIPLAAALVVTLAFLPVRFFLMAEPEPTHAHLPGNALIANWATMSAIFLDYARLLLVPWPLWPEHSVRVHEGFAAIRPLLGAVLLAGLVLWITATWRKKPAATFLAAATLVALLPVSNAIPFHIIFAERYLYIPCAFFCGAVGLALERASRTRTGTALAAGLVILLCAMTAFQNTRWRDDLTLWRHTVAHDPRSQDALYNLGNEMTERNELDAAVDLYNRSLSAPLNRFFVGAEKRYGRVYYNLGRVYQRLSKDKAALECYRQALNLEPGRPKYLLNFAVALARLGHSEEAREIFEALSVEASSEQRALAFKNLGVYHAMQGEFDKAREAFRQSLTINAGDDETRRMLADLDAGASGTGAP